jgi:hypothetical protein
LLKNGTKVYLREGGLGSWNAIGVNFVLLLFGIAGHDRNEPARFSTGFRHQNNYSNRRELISIRFGAIENYANRLELFPTRFEAADAENNSLKLFPIDFRP